MSRILEVSLIVCVLAGVGAAMLGASSDPEPEMTAEAAGGDEGEGVSPFTTGSIHRAAGGTYILTASGMEGACTLRRGEKLTATISRVQVDGACDAALRGISRATRWEERADETVVLSIEGVDPIVTFGIGDGVAYESYRPKEPVLTLRVVE